MRGWSEGEWDVIDAKPKADGYDLPPPLESPVEVTGPIEATLHAATSARDTDWFMRLVAVQPDGRSLFPIVGRRRPAGAKQGPSRRGAVEFRAAQHNRASKDLSISDSILARHGNVFQHGHRIRVEISSSWYPYFLVNLNTGADNLAMVSMSEAVVEGTREESRR